MKRVLTVLVLAVMLLASSVLVSAVYSPELPTEPPTGDGTEPSTGGTETTTCPTCPRRCRRWPCRGGYYYEYEGGYGGYIRSGYNGSGYGGYNVVYRDGGSGSGNGVVVVDMSPKTGYADINAFAVCTVAGVLMCGSLAIYSAKKIKENNN